MKKAWVAIDRCRSNTACCYGHVAAGAAWGGSPAESKRWNREPKPSATPIF